jgi:hypothetical protein
VSKPYIHVKAYRDHLYFHMMGFVDDEDYAGIAVEYNELRLIAPGYGDYAKTVTPVYMVGDVV